LNHPWVKKAPMATPEEAQKEILLKNNKSSTKGLIGDEK
jgi:hypothetical protein